MRTCEIFETVSRHQIEGMMLHDQLADAFEYLALPGFAMMHEYRFAEESKAMRKLHAYYIRRHHAIIPEGHPAAVDLLKSWRGADWQQAMGMRRKGAHELFQHWVEWEKATKVLYQQIVTELRGHGEVAAAHEVMDLVEDVDAELAYAEDMHMRLDSIAYDMPTVEQMQEGLEEEYRDKLRALWE